MLYTRLPLLLVLLLLCALWLSAQTLETASGFPYTPENLIETVFLGDGLEIIDVQFEGNDRQVGFFQGGAAAVGTNRGLMMSTGRVKGTFSQVDIENVGADFADTDWPDVVAGDPFLDVYQPGVNLNDVVRYTIRFRPYGDSIRFRYVFASEEYPEFVCSGFNDIFGFFISGPGISGPFPNGAKNIALVPGTNLPVRINTVNDGTAAPTSDCMPPNGSLANSQFYRNNTGTNFQPVFDGLTTIFVAESEVIPCEEYVMTLVLADVGDGSYDSGVFLEAKSFEGNALDLTLGDVSLDNAMAEGCRPATVTFSRTAPALVDEFLDYRIFGTAIPGVDYTALPNDIRIPAGQNSVTFTIDAFEDNLVEGDEFIHIELVRSPCLTDTFTIRISDNLIRPPNLVDSLEVCPGDTIALDASLPINFPPLKIFRSTDTVLVGPVASSYSSFIEVFDAVPEIIRDGVIRAVCIDSFTHQWIDDLDLYLIGPNGQIMELTTDNGGDGGNGFQLDAYVGTCFTPRAVDSIRGMGTLNAPPELVPFTGDWIPEGQFDNLYNGVFTTNGTWELRIIDDSNAGVGTLWRWSIHLEPTYAVDYVWTPDTSLTCYDCPMPLYLGEDEGTFYLNATDSYGCMVEDSVAILYRPGPTIDLPTCEISTDSSIVISWNPVAEALSYEVRQAGRGWLNLGMDLNYTFQNLVPDSTYSLYVRAIFADCPSAQANIFCRTSPCVPPLLSVTPTDISCAGENDGRIVATAMGNRRPFAFALDGVLNATGTWVNLAAGTYRVMVTDTVGCQDSIDVLLREPEPLLTTIVVSEGISCFQAGDGVLAASMQGGTLPYTYTWNNVPGDSLLTNVIPGGYLLRVTDGNGCTGQAQLTVTQPSPLTVLTATTSSRNCTGPPNGSITFNAIGGTANYTYAWNDPNIGNTGNPTGLEAGSYAVTLTDAGGCTLTQNFTIQLEAAVVVQGEETDIGCFGENTGSITTSVEVGSAPFEFTWAGPGNPVGNEAITNLVAGVYVVTVTDGRGCQDSLRFTVDQPSAIMGRAAVTPVGCNDLASGALNWTGSGGSLPYTFSWSNGSTTEDITELTAGEYTVVVTDGNGCNFTETYTVTALPQVSLTSVIEPVRCAGEANGAIFPNFVNITPPLTYNWISSANDTIRTVNLENAAAGNYRIEGQDANGCTFVLPVAIPEPAPLVVNAIVEDIRCNGEVNGLIELDAAGGTPGYQYRMQGQEWQANNAFVGLVAGDYRFEVRDQNNCVAEPGIVVITEPQELFLELGENRRIRFGDSIQLFPSIQGGSTIVSYAWSPLDSLVLSCTECAVPYAKPIGQVLIRLRITDDRGCTAEDVVQVFVDKDFPLEVPTGFTPNGDGQNDRLIVHGLPGVQVLSFQVFDRWGEMVYEALDFPVNDTTLGWGGDFKGQPVNGGVYLWQAAVRLPDGEVDKYSGATNLLR